MFDLEMICYRCGENAGIVAVRVTGTENVCCLYRKEDLQRGGEHTPITELRTTLCATCERDDLLKTVKEKLAGWSELVDINPVPSDGTPAGRDPLNYVYQRKGVDLANSGTVDFSVFNIGSFYPQIPSKQKIGGVLLADDKPAFFYAYCACGQVSPMFRIKNRGDGVYSMVCDMDGNPLADCSKTEWVCPQCFSSRKW